MTDNWKDLPTFQDVAEAQAQGWEIEMRHSSRNWEPWHKASWQVDIGYRARPRQPKMKKVKQLCFFSETGIRYDVLENGKYHGIISDNFYWTRVPSEDKEIEVPDEQ